MSDGAKRFHALTGIDLHEAMRVASNHDNDFMVNLCKRLIGWRGRFSAKQVDVVKRFMKQHDGYRDVTHDARPESHRDVTHGARPESHRDVTHGASRDAEHDGYHDVIFPDTFSHILGKPVGVGDIRTLPRVTMTKDDWARIIKAARMLYSAVMDTRATYE